MRLPILQKNAYLKLGHVLRGRAKIESVEEKHPHMA